MLEYSPSWIFFSGKPILKSFISLLVSAFLFVESGNFQIGTCDALKIFDHGMPAVFHSEKSKIKSNYLFESIYFSLHFQFKNVSGRSLAILRLCYSICFTSCLIFIGCAELRIPEQISKRHQNPWIFSCLFARGP